MARRVVVGVLSLLGFWHGVSAPANAQQLLDDLYGQGVHAFYQGDLETSARWLGEAIDQGTRDPRAFYFRGLARLKLGEVKQAEADFARGAEIETAGTDQYFPVADSLARVQGNARMRIEQARREARSTARDRAIAREQARYEATVAAEARVLRGRDSIDALLPQVTVSTDLELPFPQEPVGTNSPTSFDVLGDAFATPKPELPEPSGDPADDEPLVDSDPFGADETEEAQTTQEMPADPLPGRGDLAGPAAVLPGERRSSGVIGGLLRAFGRQLPDPTPLIPGFPGVPGQDDAEPTEPAVPFDPSQPETPAGVDPFGTGGRD